MNLEPLFDRIIIRHIEEDEDPDRRIVIPDTAKEKSMIAEVVAVGPGKDHPWQWNDYVKLPEQETAEPGAVAGKPHIIPMRLRVGDVVLIGKYAGIPFEWEDESYSIASESEVLARLPERED